MTKVADKLREARALIERPEGWTQGAYAIGKSGREVSPAGPFGVCFCAAGALGHANRDWPNCSLPGMKELARAVGGVGYEVDVLDWNDAEWRTQAEVLAAFDKAIELAEVSA